MVSLAESVLSSLKLSPRILFAVWVFGAVVLLMPVSFAGQFGIDEFRATHRQWIGVGTLAAFVLWLTHMILAANVCISRKQGERRRRRAALAHLQNLSSDERLLLAYFVHRGAPTQHLVLNYAPARALVSKGLLFSTPGQGNMFDWPYIIPDFVWKEIQARRDKLFPRFDSVEFRQVMYDYPRRMRDRNLFSGL